MAMKRILVVEDEAAIREMIALNLKMGGYEVEAVGSAEEALPLVGIGKPEFDVALLDIMLPGMNGFSLCEQLRREHSRLGIIILSAKTQEADKISGLSIGADDYMTKPVDEEELLLRIKALLRRCKSPSEQKLRFNDLSLDFSKMMATVGGTPVDLTQKEFLLLFKLLSQVGKIFTRNELMEEIWGTTEKDDRTLNVHINRIREKLGGVKSIEIKSIRGLGYKAVKVDG